MPLDQNLYPIDPKPDPDLVHTIGGVPMFPQEFIDRITQKTLRDEFAMAALTGMLANYRIVERQAGSLPEASTTEEHNANMRSSLLAESYAFADDAIEARKK